MTIIYLYRKKIKKTFTVKNKTFFKSSDSDCHFLSEKLTMGKCHVFGAFNKLVQRKNYFNFIWYVL